MTREKAIKVLEKQFDKSCGNYRYQNAEKLDFEDALWMAISALRQKERFGEANKTLTLGELRQMPIRDWVWIEILNPDAFRSKETVSAYYRKYDGYKADEIFWCGYPGLGFGFDYADYGKTWLAYRQKPEEDKHENLD